MKSIFHIIKHNAQKVWLPTFLLIFLFSFSACSHDDETPTVAMARTVLVYMMADNTLTSFSDSDISEMLEGMNNVDITENNLLVYVDTYTGTPQLIKIDKKSGKAVKTIIKTYDEQISTDETVMKSVLSDVFAKYPAESYGLVLWSHGWGWIQQTSTASSRWAGIDNNGDRYNTRYFLNISNLKSVLDAVNIHFDYILFDECYMGSVEALYDLRNYADYFIGSATEIPGPGAYYTDVVQGMFTSATSKATSNNATKVANAYYTYYNHKYDTSKRTEFSNINWIAGASVALIKSSALKNLALATKNIITKYVQNKQEIDTNSGIFCYDPLREKYFYDLDNLVSKLTGNNTNSDYTTWKTAFSNCVVSYQTTATNYMSYGDGSWDFISMSGSHGLSTYIPSSTRTQQNTIFQTIGWYTDAGWSQTGW